jgi:phenylacetate-CoA ligase
MLRMRNPDGSMTAFEVTPENTLKFIASEPLYAEDKDDPNFFSKDDILALQNKNLRREMERIADGSAYYKELFKREKIDPAKIQTVDDLKALPLTYKRDYMADPEAFKLKLTNATLYDWLWEVTYTTGTTTGVPTPFYNTINDAYATYQLIFRAMKIGGAISGMHTVNLFPLGPIPHIGFFRARDIITMSPLGQGAFACTGMPHEEFHIHRSMDYAIELIEYTEADVLVGIGSFVRRVIMKAEEQGRDYSHIFGCQLLGEAAPKGMRDDIRMRLENMGADRPFISNSYGFTEMQGALSECEEFSGCHSPDPGSYFFEVVDEETGERVPDGEVGLLCITHLVRTGTVLLRYVIGDFAAITHETCPHCGRNSVRMQVAVGSTYASRTSELINLKGTLINPEIMRDEIANTAGVAEYQIVLTTKDPNDPYSGDELIIKVAAMPSRAEGEIEVELQERMRKAVEMTAKIDFVEMSEIFDPTVTLKAMRIVDMRPTE